MPHNISLSALADIVAETHFANKGDDNERTNWPVFKERFPNCELYWRYLIIPGSNWILPRQEGQSGFGHRTTVSNQLLQIWYRHYSLFVQLNYAFWHISLGSPSSFENFYTHLGSACDLAEDFLLFNYILILECEGKQSPMSQQMSKDEFLTLA